MHDPYVAPKAELASPPRDRGAPYLWRIFAVHAIYDLGITAISIVDGRFRMAVQISLRDEHLPPELPVELFMGLTIVLAMALLVAEGLLVWGAKRRLDWALVLLMVLAGSMIFMNLTGSVSLMLDRDYPYSFGWDFMTMMGSVFLLGGLGARALAVYRELRATESETLPQPLG